MKNPTKRVQVIANCILALFLGGVLYGIGYFGYELYTRSAQQERLKEDYSTVNSISFGVFSIDLWSEKLGRVVTDEIKDFEVLPEHKKLLQRTVEKQLHEMVNEVVKDFTKPQKSLGDKLKKFAFKQFVDPKELHREVPGFAKLIVDRLTSKRATGKIKNIALTKFDELQSQTYDSTRVAARVIKSAMYQKYKVKTADAFNRQLEKQLDEIRKVTYTYAYLMLGMAAITLVLWIFLRKLAYLHTTLFVMSLLIALVLLWVGVTVSIVEVDARLSSLHILLLGERISFENQVLFFQSKSIWGIAQALIAQPKPDSVTVGILILLFVVALPMLRIIARGMHMLCKPIIAENGFTRYLAFESEKWDMADVMVVGILMTYIGLNGILKSQLTDLNMKTEFMESATVNYSSIQPGYIIFVGYVVFGIFLSFMLKQITCKPKTAIAEDPK